MSQPQPLSGLHPAWRLQQRAGIYVLEAVPLTHFAWLVHGFSTTPGGVSSLAGRSVLNLGYTEWDRPHRVIRNRRRFLAAVGADGLPLVTLRQIHSDLVHTVTAPPRTAARGDAQMSRTPGLLLAVGTADCVPILLVDPEHRAVAAVHAGWRGTLKRIAEKTVGRMQMEFGSRPASLLAALGPAIGACCYEVGPEVAAAFAGQFSCAANWFAGPFGELATGQTPTPLPWLTMAPPGHTPPPKRVRLDLIAANRWQLEAAGVRPENIFSSGLCTACCVEWLFSYRRERSQTGRLLGVIGLRT
ncbi:MAG: peptidoglycan editing factor PgeF [Firmicutes bacterium]|nr:peptidoglycan editing factor PgeF [Bacillota bacterium]